ncbi:MAG: DUF4160 domain-containing protein [Acidobacteria bacterium]|nr:DUF4160 domain-containing protein [Acidobacteriota bacterium]
MPTISRFFGIVIRMYHREHAPPHFHVIYQDQWAAVAIESLAIIEGRLSRRAAGLVLDWAELHRNELMENWRLAEAHKRLKPIRPLE